MLLWNVLINGNCKVGEWEKGVELFEGMGVRYGLTCSCLINGLLGVGEVGRAVEVWRGVEEKDVVIWNTMIHVFFWWVLVWFCLEYDFVFIIYKFLNFFFFFFFFFFHKMESMKKGWQCFLRCWRRA